VALSKESARVTLGTVRGLNNGCQLEMYYTVPIPDFLSTAAEKVRRMSVDTEHHVFVFFCFFSL